MAASGHDMRDVELVEEDGAPGVDLPRPAAGPGRSVRVDDAAPEPRAPRRRRTLALTAVVVLGLVVGDVTVDARARAGQAALDRVPGVVAPLNTPPSELWRSDPTLRPELTEAGGLFVGVMGARGSADVVGLDPATGAVVWRTVVRERGPGDGGGGVRCVAPAPAVAPGGSGRSDGPPGTVAPTVVCVVDRAARRDAQAPRTAAPEDRLLTLDARSGAVLADRVVERSTVLSALDGDVVVGHVDADGYVRVVRTDPLGEEVRWSFVTPRPLPVSHLAWATRVSVDGGVVVVDEVDGWAIAGDGRVLHSWAAGSLGLVGSTLVVGGGRYLVRPRHEGTTWQRSDVTDLRSGRTFAVAGRPLPTWPDDGSVEPVLLHGDGSGALVAHDGSGAAAWSVEGSVQGRALVVDGRLVRVGSTELSGIDGRTGEVLWTTPRLRSARTSLLTDGRLVMVTEHDRADGVVLRAYGLEDGRLRWTADLADDVGALVAFGDHLFGWTGQQLVALGVPGG